MPPQGENINPEAMAGIPNAEVTKVGEVSAASEAPKEAGRENLNDQGTALPTVAPLDPAQKANDPASAPADPVVTSDEQDVNEIDGAWVGAVDQVIEKTEGKPYEEEEEAEGLQIKYLLKRFGKILKRDKTQK